MDYYWFVLSFGGTDWRQFSDWMLVQEQIEKDLSLRDVLVVQTELFRLQLFLLPLLEVVDSSIFRWR